MSFRTVTVALLLCVAIALPVAASAGECQAVVVFFQSANDVLNIINLENRLQHIGFQYIRNDGVFVIEAQVPLDLLQRYHVTAQEVYSLTFQTPAIANSYVRIIGSDVGPGFFSATVTHGAVVREPFCVSRNGPPS